MNTFIFFAICLSVAIAAPLSSVQVHHDTLGNYNLRFSVPGISRVEDRDAFGNINGGFSYYDDLGYLRHTEFTSGAHGFNAIGSDIPVPVQDTPEVAQAKAEHLAVLHAAYLASPPSPHYFDY